MAKRLSDTERTVMVCTRVKESQAVKLKKLGGSRWIRKQIDKARLPTGIRKSAERQD